MASTLKHRKLLRIFMPIMRIIRRKVHQNQSNRTPASLVRLGYC
jgi:hypothetical protein